MTSSSSSLGPGGRFGDYTIDSQLGRGGMAVVFLAEDQRLGRQVAIKVLAEELAEDESFRTRFVRESQLAASLDHPNIIPVYEAGELDGHLFIAMRYVRGTDLRTVIVRDGPLDARRTVELVRPIASALDAAHRRGLVHRDVKPANILVAVDEGDEHPYLSDFGLTKHASSKSGLTKTGTFMGTVDYVAPEQIKGEEVDGRTDEYSLACLVYQCLTGKVPFDKEADVATMFGHLQDPIPKVTDVRADLPPAIDEVLARGMAKDREDRFPTCTAMMQAFARAAGLETGPQDQPSFDPAVVAVIPQSGAGPMLPDAPDGPSTPPTSTGAPTPPTPPSPTAPAPSPGPARASSKRGLLIAGIVAAVAVVGAVVVISLGGGSEPSPGGAGSSGAASGASGSSTGPTGSSGANNAVFSNTDPISIPDAGPATPYPSSIDVSGLSGTVSDVNVILSGFQHDFPRDIDMVLVGPTGQTAFLMEGAGGQEPASGVTLAFDDTAPPIPPGKALVTGTFRPTTAAGDGFGFNGPPPVPDPPYGATLAGFNGTDPNGTWSLFVFDDSAGSAGQIAGGWTLNIEVEAAAGPTGAGTVLFSDDFADQDPLWTGTDPFGRASMEQGGGTLSITLKTGGQGFTTTDAVTPATNDVPPLTDVRVEARASMVSPTPSSAYGVVCRSPVPNEYYWFLVYPNGDYDIGKRSNDGQDVVVLADGHSDVIESGDAFNVVAGECQDGPDGSTVVLRMFVNGIAVASAVDANHPLGPGLVGVIVEEYGKGAEVVFEEFSVSTP